MQFVYIAFSSQFSFYFRDFKVALEISKDEATKNALKKSSNNFGSDDENSSMLDGDLEQSISENQTTLNNNIHRVKFVRLNNIPFSDLPPEVLEKVKTERLQKKNVTILTHTKDIFNQNRRRLNTGSSVNGSLDLDTSTSDSSDFFRQDSSSDQLSEHLITNGINLKVPSKQSHLSSLIINVCNSSNKPNKSTHISNKPSDLSPGTSPRDKSPSVDTIKAPPEPHVSTSPVTVIKNHPSNVKIRQILSVSPRGFIDSLKIPAMNIQPSPKLPISSPIQSLPKTITPKRPKQKAPKSQTPKESEAKSNLGYQVKPLKINQIMSQRHNAIPVEVASNVGVKIGNKTILPKSVKEQPTLLPHTPIQIETNKICATNSPVQTLVEENFFEPEDGVYVPYEIIKQERYSPSDFYTFESQASKPGLINNPACMDSLKYDLNKVIKLHFGDDSPDENEMQWHSDRKRCFKSIDDANGFVLSGSEMKRQCNVDLLNL